MWHIHPLTHIYKSEKKYSHQNFKASSVYTNEKSTVNIRSKYILLFYSLIEPKVKVKVISVYWSTKINWDFSQTGTQYIEMN